MGLQRRYPMDTYPYARTAEEESYYQQVHYFASALMVYGAAEDVLSALGDVWRQAMERSADTLGSISPPAS